MHDRELALSRLRVWTPSCKQKLQHRKIAGAGGAPWALGWEPHRAQCRVQEWGLAALVQVLVPAEILLRSPIFFYVFFYRGMGTCVDQGAHLHQNHEGAGSCRSS